MTETVDRLIAKVQGEIMRSGSILRPSELALTVAAVIHAEVNSDLCQDEGCDHHGTPHVCVSVPKVAPNDPLQFRSPWMEINWDGLIAFDTPNRAVLVRKKVGEGWVYDLATQTMRGRWVTSQGQPLGGYEQWCEIPS